MHHCLVERVMKIFCIDQNQERFSALLTNESIRGSANISVVLRVPLIKMSNYSHQKICIKALVHRNIIKYYEATHCQWVQLISTSLFISDIKMAWKIKETLLALHIIYVNACSLPSTFRSLTSLSALHSRVLLFMTARVRASLTSNTWLWVIRCFR